MNEVQGLFYLIIVLFGGTTVDPSALDFVSTQEYPTLEMCEEMAAIVLNKFKGQTIVYQGDNVWIKKTRCMPQLPLAGF